MPTPPPPKVKEPSSATEQLARTGAVSHVKKLCEHLEAYAYNTRSHMPAGLDYTDFSEALNKVVQFCEARPDWTLGALEPLMMDVTKVRHNVIATLREVVEKLEK